MPAACHIFYATLILGWNELVCAIVGTSMDHVVSRCMCLAARRARGYCDHIRV